MDIICYYWHQLCIYDATLFLVALFCFIFKYDDSTLKLDKENAEFTGVPKKTNWKIKIIMSKVLENPVQSILEKTAINMLKDKIDLKFISSVTGFSEDELLKLKSTI